MVFYGQWRTYIFGTLKLELSWGPLGNQQQQDNIQQGPKGLAALARLTDSKWLSWVSSYLMMRGG